MDPLMKLVTTALKWSYAQAEADVTSQHLKAAAELLTLWSEPLPPDHHERQHRMS